MTKFKAVTEKGGDRYWRQSYFKEEIERQDRAAYEYMLNDRRGRWFLMRLFDCTFVNATTYTGNSNSFFNEGKRAVGINVNNKIVELLGMKGITARQLAEREYIETQRDAQRMISEQEEMED